MWLLFWAMGGYLWVLLFVLRASGGQGLHLTFLVAFAFGEVPTGDSLPQNALHLRKELRPLTHSRD